MLYEEYEKKIIKRAKVKRFFYRFRILFITSISAALVTTGALVGTKGIVTDKNKLHNTYFYGESYRYLSESFMSDTSYEFSLEDKEEWSKEEPRLIGKYKMRSKGKNSFNSYYYGETQHFEIVPKSISVFVQEDSFTYGEEPHINLASDLVYGDTLQNDYTFTYSDRTKDVWNITPNKDSLHILSSSGEDVTNCYLFNIVTKGVNILKRELSVASGSSYRVYDGKKFEDVNFEIKKGELVPGDTISLVGNSSITDVGETSNNHDYKITNQDKLNMTGHYNIKKVPGTIKIYPRAITLSSIDHEYTYDGYDHKFTLDEVTITEGSLAVGQHLVIDYESDEKHLNAGEYLNKFKAKVLDGNDIDVTSNYNITLNFGKTNILKRKITATSDGGTKTYDKKSYYVNTASLVSGTLADKDQFSVGAYPSFTDSGTYDNELTITIIDKNTGEDVSLNYDISLQTGKIVIKQVDLKVELEYLEVTYDGKPHKNTFKITEGKLVDGDTIIEKYNPERTDADLYDNEDFEAVIKDENNLDNSKNYNVTYTNTEKVLKINKRPLTIESLNKEKVYDALSMRSTFADDESFYSITSGALAEDEYLEFTYLNDATDVGTYEIQSEIVIRHQLGESKDKDNDKIVTSNYDINYIDGNFKINHREITIKTIDAEHVYNRELKIPSNVTTYQVEATGHGLVEGHYIKNLSVSCDGINVGSYPYMIDTSSLIILDEKNNDVTSNYKVTFINTGKLTITKRPTTVSLNSSSTMYDGKPHGSDTYTATGLLEKDYYVFTGLPSITHTWEGPLENKPTECRIFMESGVEVTDNYDITNSGNGFLNILPRPITITSPSYSKIFDGLATTFNDKSYTITGGSLADGDYITITEMYSFDHEYFHVSDSSNNYFELKIFNAEDLEVTDDYEITKNYGHITVKPLDLEYEVYGRKYVYNGEYRNINFTEDDVTPTSDYVYLSKGVMPSNYHLRVNLTISDMLLVGHYDNHTSYSVYSSDPHGVEMGDFNIKEIAGSQEIIKREITIQTAGGSKIYDEQPFGKDWALEDLMWLSSGSLGTDDYIADYKQDELIEIGANMENKIYDIVIRNGANEDVTNQYIIHYIYGEVTIYEM